MKYRNLVFTLLFAGTSSVQVWGDTPRLTSASDATWTDKVAATRSLASERSRLSRKAERQAYLASSRAQLEESKRHLFDAFNKSAPDKLESLKSLMAEAMLSMHLAHLSDQAEGGTEVANGKGLFLAQIRAETEVQIHALLGDEGYALYVAYQQSEPHRATIQQLMKAMRAQGSSITADQEQDMLDRYMDALLTATEDSVKEASPATYAGLNAAERRALGAVELCGLAPVIADPQRRRFESYLAAAVSGILSPDDFKRFQKIRSEPAPRPNWRDFVPVEYSRTL